VWLERLAPHAPIEQYWHNRIGEDNADAHLKRQIMGREVVVAAPTAAWILGRGNGSFTGSLMAAAGSGCWSRLSGTRGAQSYPEGNGLWLRWAKTQDALYDKKAGAENQTLAPA
jgi:hypothetical protein